MKFLLTERASRDYRSLAISLQKRIDKQIGLLLINPRHPSLRSKKYDETRGVWQARVSRDYRFYFVIKNATYKIVSITAHSK